jgi:hypothetical protein
MKRIRSQRPKAPRQGAWSDALPSDPRDSDIVRARRLVAPRDPGREPDDDPPRPAGNGNLL